MVQQVINIGTAPNDGTGDSVRTAFNKVNSNFTELYTNGVSGSGGVGNGYTGSRGVIGYVGSTGYVGSQGPVGTQGVSVNLLGSVATTGNLPSSGNSAGNAWIVSADGNMYLWNSTNFTWNNIGKIVGYSGSQGSFGYTGSRGAGFVGSAGYTGSLGYRGSAGTIGYTGSAGASSFLVKNAANLMLLPNGYVVFPIVTAPARSYGVAGDVAGMIAFDSTYIYYCTANYVNNTTNIWKRTAHGTGTW